METNNGSVMVN